MKVTFIGLGIMGSRMAANLIKNGVEVTIFNRTISACKPLIEIGAKHAEHITSAVENCDVVFSMLSNPDVVEELFLSENGALPKIPKDSIWVDCSTVNPSFSRKANQAAVEHGVRFIDAPVAGTLPHAANGELVFFVGGETSTLKTVEPLLMHMGKKVMHIGETSKGASFKMIVNMMLAQSMVVFSEAILLGEKMGLDKSFLLNTVPNLVVSAPFTKFKSEMIKEGKYEVQFPLELMHKDLQLAATTAYELDQPLYLNNLVKELFASAKQQELGRADFAAIHKYLESN